VDPSGKFAYVANGSDVAMYTISDTAGGLASIGTIAAGAGLFLSRSPSTHPADSSMWRGLRTL